MGQGRGSALVVIVAMLCLFAIIQPTFARTYTINWTYNVNGWPRGKLFRAGDVLVFNYPKALHNVVAVSSRGYARCSAPRGARPLQSGSDKITLRRGLNYFICGVPGHCQGGMKIAIKAA